MKQNGSKLVWAFVFALATFSAAYPIPTPGEMDPTPLKMPQESTTSGPDPPPSASDTKSVVKFGSGYIKIFEETSAIGVDVAGTPQATAKAEWRKKWQSSNPDGTPKPILKTLTTDNLSTTGGNVVGSSSGSSGGKRKADSINSDVPSKKPKSDNGQMETQGWRSRTRSGKRKTNTVDSEVSALKKPKKGNTKTANQVSQPDNEVVDAANQLPREVRQKLNLNTHSMANRNRGLGQTEVKGSFAGSQSTNGNKGKPKPGPKPNAGPKPKTGRKKSSQNPVPQAASQPIQAPPPNNSQQPSGISEIGDVDGIDDSRGSEKHEDWHGTK